MRCRTSGAFVDVFSIFFEAAVFWCLFNLLFYMPQQ